MTTACSVTLVLPDSVDDPGRPSGGNVYDRRMRDWLRHDGWGVHAHLAHGSWPRGGGGADELLARRLRELPDGRVVLVDGLVAAGAVRALLREGRRLRLVVLVHMPGVAGDDDRARRDEGRVLRAARAVVATSDWSASRLARDHALDHRRLHVVPPGTDTSPAAPGTPVGGNLLCLGAVSRAKGHDVLLAASQELEAMVPDVEWRLRCVGPLHVDSTCVARLRSRATSPRQPRVSLDGPLTGSRLEEVWLTTDLLVLPTRSESFGMVVTEALAHGVPVVASDVGGVPEALGRSPDGRRPGMLVPPGQAAPLARALACWLADAGLRERWRADARARRSTLRSWAEAGEQLSGVIRQVAS